MNDNEENLLWNILWKHRNHKLEVVWDDGDAASKDVCLKCLDCNEVVLIFPQETE